MKGYQYEVRQAITGDDDGLFLKKCATLALALAVVRQFQQIAPQHEYFVLTVPKGARL